MNDALWRDFVMPGVQTVIRSLRCIQLLFDSHTYGTVGEENG